MFKIYLAYYNLNHRMFRPVIRKLTKSATKRGHHNLALACQSYESAMAEHQRWTNECVSFKEVVEKATNPTCVFNNRMDISIDSLNRALKNKLSNR